MSRFTTTPLQVGDFVFLQNAGCGDEVKAKGTIEGNSYPSMGILRPPRVQKIRTEITLRYVIKSPLSSEMPFF